MPERFIEIDEPGDMPAFFEAICEKVLRMPALEVKRAILSVRGSDKLVGDYAPSASDIIKLCEKKKLSLKLSMRLEYHDDTFHSGEVSNAITSELSPAPAEQYTLMENQKKEINADLRVITILKSPSTPNGAQADPPSLTIPPF